VSSTLGDHHGRVGDRDGPLLLLFAFAQKKIMEGIATRARQR
jgi:hypothetical protein